LEKNRPTEVIELLFCYFTSVPAEGSKIWPIKEASTFDYKLTLILG